MKKLVKKNNMKNDVFSRVSLYAKESASNNCQCGNWFCSDNCQCQN